MGWCTQTKPRNVKHYFDNIYVSTDTTTVSVLASKLYLTHYVALLSISSARTNHKPIVITDFVLLHYESKGCELSYKPLGEECLRYYVPKDFLPKLTPINDRIDLVEPFAGFVRQHRERSRCHYNHAPSPS